MNDWTEQVIGPGLLERMTLEAQALGMTLEQWFIASVTEEGVGTLLDRIILERQEHLEHLKSRLEHPANGGDFNERI